GRRVRALPEASLRAPGGELLVGSLALLPPRRALRVGGTTGGAGAPDEAVGVLPPQLLALGRGRRGDGAAVRRGLRRRQPGLLDGLSARRLEVPARRGELPHAATVGAGQAENPVGQLEPALRCAGAHCILTTEPRRCQLRNENCCATCRTWP